MTFLRTFIRDHPRAVGIGLVGTSLLVLLLAAVTVGGWLRPDETGDATSTPTLTAEPSQDGSSVASPSDGTATPSPTPTSNVSGSYTLTDIGTPLFSSVWTRVTVDVLNVRREAGNAGEIVGTLQRDDLVLVTGDSTEADGRFWMPIVADGLAGWAAEYEGDTTYLQPVGTPWHFGARRVFNGVVSNGDTFLAYGWASDLVVQPYEGTGASPLAYVSTDGTTWTPLTNLQGRLEAAAGSADGFVIVSVPTYIEPTTIRLSDDGSSWSEPIAMDLQVPSAAFGPAGPIVTGRDYSTDEIVVVHASDADGAPLRVSSGEIGTPQIEGSAAGYAVFDRYGPVHVLVSTDGITWQQVTVPGLATGQHLVRDVELVGNRLVVVANRTDTGASLVRQGTLTPAGSVTWSDRTDATGLQDATVDSISAAPDGTLLALGWERDELLPMAWRSTDGWSWTDLGVAPDSFGGGIGPEPAYAGGRWAAVSDGIYSSTDGAAWSVRVPAPAQPDGPGCPSADEVTALDLLFLGDAAADCYGDTELTLTAWAPLVDGLGGCCFPDGLPDWLNPAIPGAWLAPGPTGLGGAFGVYLSPDMDGSMLTDAWVEVSGHFHDPAAMECRRVPLTSFPHRLESRAALIAGCLGHFVVDRVVPATGPSG